MDIESRVDDFLNPCKFGDNIRQQTYVQPDSATAGPGQKIQVTLPSETLDLSASYIEFDIQVTNVVASTPLNINILIDPAVLATTPPTAGLYQIYYDGELIANVPLAQNITNTVLALNANLSLSSRGITVTSPNNPADTIVTPGGLFLFFNSVYANKYLISINPISVISNLYGIGGGAVQTTPITLNVVSNYAPQTPRLEKTLPLFNLINVDWNSQTIIDVNQANVIMGALQLLDPINERPGKNIEYAYEEYGWSLNTGQTIRMKLDLKFIDLFKKILPINLLQNTRITISLTVESANRVLICSTATNSANQSFTLSNIKFNYHKLQLTDSDRSMILSRMRSDVGLIIPFKSWHFFVNTVATGASTANVIFNPAVKHLLGILIMFLGNDYAQDARNVRKLSTFLRNAVADYRLKVGSTYFPVDKVSSSNSYRSLVEPVRTLVEFTEVFKEKRINNDLECFLNYGGNYALLTDASLGNDPNNLRWDPITEEYIRTASIMAILCSDVGYSSQTELCSRLFLNGIDVSNQQNVALELNNMITTQPNSLYIYALSQEYLRIDSSGTMTWHK